MQLQLNFGGFYQSVWDSILDNELEYMCEDMSDHDELDAFYDNVSWIKTYNKASEYITDLFNQVMLDYGYIINVEFERLNRPKFYNFETDVIILKDYDLDTLENALIGVLNELDAYEVYNELLKDATTSRSGYIAFYSIDTIEQYQKINLMIEALFLNDKFISGIIDGLSANAYDIITFKNEQ